MENVSVHALARRVLFINGIVDLVAALLLFFPVFNLPLPGYDTYTSILAFVAGGWGVATLALGVVRIWSSYKPTTHILMVSGGIIEGILLAIFCVVNIQSLGITALQASLPLTVGGVFGVLNLIALLRMVGK